MKDILRWTARTMTIVCKLLALFKQMLEKAGEDNRTQNRK